MVSFIETKFIVDELIEFAQAHHPGFEGMPDETLKIFFETYKDTTLVWQKNGEIYGFAVYQEWPDLLNFICVATIGSRAENLRAILKVVKVMSRKKICYFDETKMEVRTLCHF